jgi:hypothetical protein
MNLLLEIDCAWRGIYVSCDLVIENDCHTNRSAEEIVDMKNERAASQFLGFLAPTGRIILMPHSTRSGQPPQRAASELDEMSEAANHKEINVIEMPVAGLFESTKNRKSAHESHTPT